MNASIPTRRIRRPCARGTRALAVLLLLLLAAHGCSRSYYRREADGDAWRLVTNASQATRDPLGGFSIDVDPRSRFYDEYDPDHPPLPPDDPAAHRLMHCVDCKRGYPCWHANGDIHSVENPYWAEYLQYDEDGCVVLSLEDAVQVARMHSRDYQRQLEELYLSALDVSFERFRFDAQFFGGNDTFLTADGRVRAGGQSSSILNTDTGLQMQKMFAAGGELVVGFANTFVWQFASSNTYGANTLLDFSLVQPLLRAGGRQVVMERLTLSERVLLANVRAMERFQRGFYTEIATGQEVVQGPSRRGGFFGGAGLEGFTGVGGGGFGRVGGGGGGFGGAVAGGGAGAAAAGGYLGLLQAQRQIENQESNVLALCDSLELLKKSNERQVRELRRTLAQNPTPQQLKSLQQRLIQGPLQEQQVMQRLYEARARLESSKAEYVSDVDRFKTDLGLPPDLPVRIKDDLLDQFELLPPELVRLRADAQFVPASESFPEEFRLRIALLQLKTRQLICRVADAVARLRDNAPQIKQNLQRLRERTPRDTCATAFMQPAQRLQCLHAPDPLATEQFEARLGRIEDSFEEIVRDLRAAGVLPPDVPIDEFCRQQDDPELDAAVAQMEQIDRLARQDPEAAMQQFAGFAEQYRQWLPELPEPPPQRPPAPGEQQGPPAPQPALQPALHLVEQPAGQPAEQPPGEPPPEDALSGGRRHPLVRAAAKMATVHARALLESAVLPPVDLQPAEALAIARECRRDWMNARTQLVDTWRLIEFNANNLESDLDIVFSGDLGTTDDNPFRFRDTTGRLRVGFEFDAPLARLGERNVYRESLIEYQQARRNYMAFVDFVNRGLRNTFRTLELDAINFQLRRAAVQVAIRQVELIDLGFAIEANSARDSNDALADLLTAQNDFMSFSVNYQVQRILLDLSLGTMQLDERGVWIDPGGDLGRTGCGGTGCPAEETLPPEGAGQAPEELPPLMEAAPLPPEAG